MSTEITRHDFLCGAAAAAVDVAAVGALGSQASIAKADEALSEAPATAANPADELEAPYLALDASAIEEMDADLCIIGAGPAGLCAAVKAAENGLKVVLIEKSTVSGGQAMFGMGILAIGTRFQEEMGEPLELEDMYAFFTEYTHYRTDPALVYHYFSESNNTLEWLEGMGVEFAEAARYFNLSYPTWHIVALAEGQVIGGGVAKNMTNLLEAKVLDMGSEILFESTGCKVELTDGKVSGICAYTNDESKGYHTSCPAAMIATGGFGNNPERVKEELGFDQNVDYFGMQIAGHEGDGLHIGWKAGVKKSDIRPEMIYDIYRVDDPGPVHTTSDILLILKQPNLLVNQEGKRFMVEEQVQNTTFCGNALSRQPGYPGFMICDQAIFDEIIADNVVDFNSRVDYCDDFSNFDEDWEAMLESGDNAIMRADTLDEVAEYMGIDAENLKATIEEYNECCEAGFDPLGMPANHLKPISTPPYYAAQYYPSAYGTLGGLRVNANLECLDENDQVIPGLYSAGTDCCTIYGDSYCFLLPGNTMGFAVNSGRFVGENITEYLCK